VIRTERASRPLRSGRSRSRGDGALLARVQALEDRAEIAALLSRYGPAVDTLDGDAVAALWSEPGSYSFDDTVLTGDAIGGLVDLPQHRALVAAGCGHLLTAPDILVRGDHARAVNHSAVLMREGEGWRAVRLSANRWEFVRTPAGWRISSRITRLLDGGSAARALLAPQTDTTEGRDDG